MKHCEIVCDLLPLYIEKLTSQESEAFLREHLADCKECQTVLAHMQAGSLKTDTTNETTQTNEYPERRDFQNALRTHKRKIKQTTLCLTLLCIVFSVFLCLGLLWYKGVFHIIERQTSPNGATTTTVYNCDFASYGRFPQSGGFTLIDKGYFNGSTTYPGARFQGLWWSVDGNYQVVSMYTDEGIWLCLADYRRNIGVNLDAHLERALYENSFFQDVIYNEYTGQYQIEFQFIQWSLVDEPNMLIYFSYTDASNQFHEGYFWFNYETTESSGEMEL